MGKLIVTEFMTLDASRRPRADRTRTARAASSTAAGNGRSRPGVRRGDVPGGQQHESAAAGPQDLRHLRRVLAPGASTEMPFTALLNSVPKYVASRTLAEPLSWSGSTLLSGDFGESITALKQRYDEVQVIGSLDMVQSLLRLGLVDTMNLWVYPLVLGTGKKVFDGGTVPTALRLTASQIYPAGAAPLTYETAGAPTYATMPEPAEPLSAPATGDQLSTVDFRRLWPDILTEVKNRRRFTWILLSQNAHVIDVVDGVLSLGMSNQGARDSFGRGGSEDVLREAILQVMATTVKIQVVIDAGQPAPEAPPTAAPVAQTKPAPSTQSNGAAEAAAQARQNILSDQHQGRAAAARRRAQPRRRVGRRRVGQPRRVAGQAPGRRVDRRRGVSRPVGLIRPHRLET